MPTPLNESDTLVFLHEYAAAIQQIPQPGAVVILWPDQNIPVLAYRTVSGYMYLTDISDLSPTQIANLGIPAISHGMLYYLPWEIIQRTEEVLQKIPETAVNVANAIGQTAGALTAPLVNNLAPLIVAALVILGFMYLPRSGHSS